MMKSKLTAHLLGNSLADCTTFEADGSRNLRYTTSSPWTCYHALKPPKFAHQSIYRYLRVLGEHSPARVVGIGKKISPASG